MATVAVALDAGVQQEAAGEGGGLEADELRVVFEAADMELAGPFADRRKQLEQVGHRAVVQEGRGGPDAVQWAGLVAALFLHADGQAEAVHAAALLAGNPGLPVGLVLDEGGDVGQALGAGNALEVDLLQAAVEQFHIQPAQLFAGPAQLADIEAVVGDVVGGGGVGADFFDGHDAHVPLGVALGGHALVRRYHAGAWQ